MHPAPHRARQARPQRPSPTPSLPGPLDCDLPRILREACERARWSYAELWLLGPDGDGLVLHPAWHGNHASARHFRPPTEALAFTPDTGLPARAVRARQLVLVPDVTVDPEFCRPTAARKAGLRVGLAVPVIAGGEVAAVLAFFGPGATEADPPLTEPAQELADLLARCLEQPVGQPHPGAGPGPGPAAHRRGQARRSAERDRAPPPGSLTREGKAVPEGVTEPTAPWRRFPAGDRPGR